MTHEIDLYDKITNPVEAVQQLGEMFTRSGLFGCQKIEQGQVMALACLSERKSPFELMKTYHLVEGRLEMKAAATFAQFIEMGGKVVWKTDVMDQETAAAYFEFGDNKTDAIYTIQDAEKEGLLISGRGEEKKNWKNNRPEMLRARLLSKVINMFAPQIRSGLYDQEPAVAEEKKSLFGASTPTDPIPDATATSEAVAAPVEEPSEPDKSPPPIVEVEAEVSEPVEPPVTSDGVDGFADTIREVGIAPAEAFMKAHEMIGETESFEAASIEWQQKIVARPGSFQTAVMNFTDQK